MALHRVDHTLLLKSSLTLATLHTPSFSSASSGLYVFTLTIPSLSELYIVKFLRGVSCPFSLVPDELSHCMAFDTNHMPNSCSAQISLLSLTSTDPSAFLKSGF